MSAPILEVLGLEVKTQDKVIISGIDFRVGPGEIHFLLGPNGSGKSTFANAIAGSPHYKVSAGKIKINGKDVTNISPENRANLGLFVAFQNPPAIEGVNIVELLRGRGKNKQSIFDFRAGLEKIGSSLKLPNDWTGRDVNLNFSGGEKKKAELVQLISIKPKVAILDEIDSGLDIDGLKVAAGLLKKMVKSGTSLVIVTHSDRLSQYLKPTQVHILSDGRLVNISKTKISQLHKIGLAGAVK